MNSLVRLFSDAANARTKKENGFDLTNYDTRALKFAEDYSRSLLAVDINIDTDAMLDRGWELMGKHFKKSEVGIKAELMEKYWVSR